MQCLNDPVQGMAGASLLDTVVLHKPLKLKQNFRIKSGGGGGPQISESWAVVNKISTVGWLRQHAVYFLMVLGAGSPRSRWQ